MASEKRLSLRDEARDLLTLHRGGVPVDALEGAANLCAEVTNSPAYLMNLVGDFNRDAFLRMGCHNSDPKQAHLYGQCAVDAYKGATVMAPRCVETAACYVSSLIEMNMYSEAEEEILRARNIHALDDPLVHHVHYDLDYMEMTPRDRINNARGKFSSVIGRFEALRDDAVREVVALAQSCNAESAQAGAAEVANRFPLSAHAQYLVVHVQVYMVQTLSRDDPKKRDTLLAAVDRMRALSVTFASSLAICIQFAKLLVVTGDYAGAVSECQRAFLIDSPNDPDVCDFPLASNVEVDYSSRVLAGKNVISELLHVVDICQKWSIMTDTEKKSLLSVNSEILIQHFASTNVAAAKAIKDDLTYFKENGTWNSWSCPFPNCDEFLVDTAELFCRHLSSVHQLQILDVPSLRFAEHGLHSTVSVCYESGQPTLFFGGLEDMIQSMLFLSCGVRPAFVEDIRTELIRKNLENLVQESYKSPEKLLKLLDAAAFDLRKHLLPFLSWFKWEQAKKPNFDSLGDFGWSFSEGLKISYESAKQNRDQERKNDGYCDSLIDFDDLLTGDKKEELKKTDSCYFDLLGDADLTASEYGLLEHKQLSVTYPRSFNLLDLGDFDLTSAEHKPVSVGNLEKTIIIQKDEKGSVDPIATLGWGDLIDFDDFDLTSTAEHKPASVGNLENPKIIQQDEKGSYDPIANLGRVTCLNNCQNPPMQTLSKVREVNSSDSSGRRHTESDISQIHIEAKTAGRKLKAQSKRKDEQEDEQASNSKGLRISQALMYATSSRSEPAKPAPSAPSEDGRKPFDVYAIESIHKRYHEDLKKCIPKHLCSACYFEKNMNVKVNPWVHYNKVHRIFGYSCKECSAKFTTKSALEFHCKYCHQEEQPG